MEVKDGSQVILIGRDKKNRIGASELAQWAGTITYEIFCALSQRVSRVYLD